MKHKRWTASLRGVGLLWLLALGTMFLLVSVAGCASGGGSGGTGHATVTPTRATATADPFVKLAQVVGDPTAKITTGANIEVTGQVKNVDKVRHDIFLQATLKDANGNVVGTATGKAEDIPAGQTVNYTLQGTVMQPSWATVTVAVTKVSENVNGTGND